MGKLEQDDEKPDSYFEMTSEKSVFFSIFLDIAHEQIDRGVEVDEAVRKTADAFIKALPAITQTTVQSLHESKSTLLDALTESRRQMESEIQDKWGTAFGNYQAVAYLAYELCNKAREGYLNSLEHGGSEDLTVEMLFLLLGRACTVAEEVLCLMRGGLEDGAVARRRTLHELAVVTNLLAENSLLSLGERYQDYAVVEQYEDMKNYQENVERLGYTPFSAEDVETVREQYDEMLTKYGSTFRKPHEWARPLFTSSTEQITFVKLEKLVKLDHLRPFYRQSNHYVHAGPRAALLNVIDRDYGSFIGVGARWDVALGEIGHGSLISLLQCTSALLAYDFDAHDNPDITVGLHCMAQLVDDAGLSFSRASSRHG
ncbi:DUF5677 domain-containing protein [Saccharothrix longispora]|uniref:Uncharacterized protein n=1 Tax=Saccharothrix longispora TaxID=33920 RepID=A0ABU1Q3U1_9PSEU|nr:DUF5677 domain-containing protein [Saccharothrix longispora]MDR6597551.1 hypothetical protein [Saccharothrix longispora]